MHTAKPETQLGSSALLTLTEIESKRRKLVDAAIFAVLAAINIIVFARSLGGYFLADDFIHVAYLANVFQGHFDLLAQNFTTNWLQTLGTHFYRPTISLTMALDYWVGGAHPLAFHISNLVYQVAATFFLFLATRRMLIAFGKRQATRAAFFAASAFAVCPLHAEVVSWVIGRVDSVCTAFYLMAFWMWLKGMQERRWGWSIAALFAFAASLTSKEMAVTLPPALALYCFLTQAGGSLEQRLAAALRLTWPLWAVLAVYMVVRALALGTLAGGYSGSIGEGLSGSLFHRWFEDGSFNRVIYPFNAEVFPPRDRLRKVLHFIYLMAGAAFLARLLLVRSYAWLRYMLFAAGWFVLSMLPTYQVWNLTESLQGSRFIYLGTAPLALFIVLAIYPLGNASAPATLVARRLTGGAAVLVTALLVVFGLIAYRNNLPWAQAGKQVKALRQELESELAALPPDKKLILINLPQRHKGAHMLYNAAMLDVLLRPPLSPTSLAERVITFEPVTYGDSDLIAVSRLRRLLAEPGRYIVCRWQPGQMRLVRLNLTAARSVTGQLPQSIPAPRRWLSLPGGSFIFSPELNLSALSADFVEIEMATRKVASGTSPGGSPPYLVLGWAGADNPLFLPPDRLALPLKADGRYHLYRFPVSEHKTWLAANVIRQIRLALPPEPFEHSVRAVRVLGGEREIPRLLVDPAEASEDAGGVARSKGDSLTLRYDASRLPDAAAVVLELSQPNSWFEHYSGTLRDSELSSHSLMRWQTTATRGAIKMPAAVFPTPAYYEARVIALRADGRPTGYFSDPINLQIAQQQIESSRRPGLVEVQGAVPYPGCGTASGEKQ